MPGGPVRAPVSVGNRNEAPGQISDPRDSSGALRVPLLPPPAHIHRPGCSLDYLYRDDQAEQKFFSFYFQIQTYFISSVSAIPPGARASPPSWRPSRSDQLLPFSALPPRSS